MTFSFPSAQTLSKTQNCRPTVLINCPVKVGSKVGAQSESRVSGSDQFQTPAPPHDAGLLVDRNHIETV